MAQVDMTGSWRPDGRWVGDLNGMLVGQCVVDFSQAEGGTLVVLRANVRGVMTEAAGLLRSTTPAAVRLDVRSGPPDGRGRIDLTLRELGPNRISGDWETSEGNAGVFVLFPGPQASPVTSPPNAPQGATQGPRSPIQIVQRTGSIAKMRLFRDEVKDLCRLMQHLLRVEVEPIISADISGKEVRMFGPDFWQQPALPRFTETVQLILNDGNTVAPPKSISITLNRSNSSFVVTGGDDLWVTGAFREVELAFERKQGRWRLLRRFYERHALNFNGIAMLLAIAYLPNLEFTQRLIMLVAAVALSLFVKVIHDATTAVRVYLTTDSKDGKLFELPRYLTALANAATIGAVTWLYHLMTQGQVQNWLQSILGVISP